MRRPDPAPSRVKMWATATPIRFRILELLREGPATASQLARRLGESSGTTSYHLRVLERARVIQEDEALGTKRERWWRRTDDGLLAPTDSDPEGRAITARYFTMFFDRDTETRRRFVTREVSDEWHEAAFAGNWFVALTPDQALQLGERLFALVNEYRDGSPTAGSERTLVSVSILPWLE